LTPYVRTRTEKMVAITRSEKKKKISREIVK